MIKEFQMIMAIYKTGAFDFAEKLLLNNQNSLTDEVKSIILNELEKFITGAEFGSIAGLKAQQDLGSNPNSSTKFN